MTSARMNENSFIVALPSSRGWKKSERKIEDVAPTKLLSGTTTTTKQADQCQYIHSDSFTAFNRPTTTTTTTKEKSKDDELFRGSNICLVCSENQARYTCPQCQTPYCSIECFRNHTKTGSSTAVANRGALTNNTHDFSCSEQFFKRKVTSVMQLESSEQEEKARRAFNRYHHENSNSGDFGEPLEDNGVGIESLYELQAQLEILETENKELSHRELAKILPPSLKAMFEKDLQNGKLKAESVLSHWYPWWKHELVVDGKNIDGNFDSKNDNEATRSSFPKILDERLLRVPKYKGFRGRKSNDDVLMYNLIDILYATSQTLRLYHGVENASRQAPVEAASTLLSISSVLSRDARFDSIHQLLNHHYNTTKENFTSSSNLRKNEEGIHGNILGKWNVSIEDIVSILASARMVGRALLEASDILKAAIKKLKLEEGSSMPKREESDSGNNETNIKEIRRLRKKLQFFLSWAISHPVAADLLTAGAAKEEILAWIKERERILSQCECSEDINSSRIVVEGCLDEGNANTAVKKLKFHHSESIPTATNMYESNSNNPRLSQQPLFVEVQSRRKT